MIITGVVVDGNKKGREFGFPTANIDNIGHLDTGIYAAKVRLEGVTYNAAVYIGTPRPQVLEAHILDFDKDIYGQKIEVEIVRKMRDDAHLPDLLKLKARITDDINNIRACLRE